MGTPSAVDNICREETVGEFSPLSIRLMALAESPQRSDSARKDSPWIWGLHPKTFSLYHTWYSNAKPNLMANNTLKYKRINPTQRSVLRQQWNNPILWPVILLVIVLILAIIPAVNSFRAKARAQGVS